MQDRTVTRIRSLARWKTRRIAQYISGRCSPRRVGHGGSPGPGVWCRDPLWVRVEQRVGSWGRAVCSRLLSGGAIPGPAGGAAAPEIGKVDSRTG